MPDENPVVVPAVPPESNDARIGRPMTSEDDGIVPVLVDELTNPAPIEEGNTTVTPRPASSVPDEPYPIEEEP